MLANLRDIAPHRRLTWAEAMRVAEVQASRLRTLSGSNDDVISERSVTSLPRIRIVRRRLPTSGISYWDGETWIIAINEDEPRARQRFTIFHEYKHIVDHSWASELYGDLNSPGSAKRAEQAADYFAGCVLMPRTLLKRAWSSGIQEPSDLADLFETSVKAVEVRLTQIGLIASRERCIPPQSYRSNGRGAA